ncbi:MAG: 16S rRNA (guanine(527)-N(7))-methyltransferase RsmG, partial [Lysobacter sp.]|nr:16S rRNA (guanine(527)-N(7))-methyltransferase RsmG [Lysobacter sp.]
MNTPAPFDAALRRTLDDGLLALGLDPATVSKPLLDYLALLVRWN